MRGLVRLHPDFSAVALEHVLKGQRRLLRADLHRLGFPQRQRVAAHDRPAPDQVQFGKVAAFCGAQADGAHAIIVAQAPGKIGQRLDQGETVHLDPDTLRRVLQSAGQAEHGFDPPPRHAEQVRGAHVLQREAGFERIRVLRQRLVDHGGELARFGGDDFGELHAARLVHFRERHQIFGGCAQARHRGAHTRGERLQERTPLRFPVHQLGHVLQREHHAGNAPGCRQERCHLHLDQGAGHRIGDKPAGRKLGSLIQAGLEFVQRMRHLIAIEQREYRAPQADQPLARARRLRPRAEQSPHFFVVQQDAPFGVAQQHALGKLRHQGGEAIALLFQPCIGYPGARFQVVPHPVIGVGQPIDGRGEIGELGSAVGIDAMLRVGREYYPGLLGERAHRRHVIPEQPAEQARTRKQQQRGGEAEHRRALLDDAQEKFVLLLGQSGRHQDGGRRHHSDDAGKKNG